MKGSAKYKNIRTEIDGIHFASRREATRYQDLKIMQRAGLISGLRLQPKYQLIVGRLKVATYVADFEYLEDGARVIEDVKGIRTAVYKLKKKLVKAIYGIEIRET